MKIIIKLILPLTAESWLPIICFAINAAMIIAVVSVVDKQLIWSKKLKFLLLTFLSPTQIRLNQIDFVSFDQIDLFSSEKKKTNIN